MKKTILLTALAGFIITSCEKKESVEGIDDTVVVTTDEDHGVDDVNNADSTAKTMDTTSKSWAGTYQGVIPCADCEGIDYEIMLHSDNTYMSSTTYMGKDKDNKFSEEGTITWNSDKTGFSTNPSKNGELSTHFILKDNAVVMVKEDGSKVKGELSDDYILNKK